MRAGRGSLAIAAAVMAACAAFPLLAALSGERVVFRRDVHLIWLTQTAVVARTLLEGAWPFWDRFSAFGRPLLADPRVALFYPPTWLGLLLPPGLAYAWLSAFHVFVGGCGAFRLARRLGASQEGALLAGASFAACGPFVSLTLMWHQLAGAAWIPWVLAAFDRLLEEPSGRRLARASVLLGLQALAGSPEYCLLTWMAAAALALPRVLAHSAGPRVRVRVRWRPLAWAAAAAALGIGLASVQWLPSAHYASTAARWSRPPDPATWALAPDQLVETLAPFRFWDLPRAAAARGEPLAAREPLLHSIYLGAPLLALAVAGLTSRLLTRGPLAAVVAAATLAALGSHTPLLELAQAVVPPLAGLRYPAKALVVASLGVALLAGFGIDRLAGPERGAARRAMLAAVVAAPLLLAAALDPAARGWLQGGAASDPLLGAAGAALLLSGIAAVLGFAAARPALRSALVALAVLAPLLQHRTLIETAPARLFATHPELLQHVARDVTGRLYAYDYQIVNEWQRITSPAAPAALEVARVPQGFSRAAALVAGAREALHPPIAAGFGIAGSFDYDVLDFDPVERAELATRLRASEASPSHLALLRLGAVTHAVGLGPAAWWRGLRVVAEARGTLRFPATLLAVPDPLPRAYAVGAVRGVPGGAALGALVAHGFDPRREAVLSPADAAATGLPLAPEASAGSEALDSEVRIVTLRGDRVGLEATLSQPGLLVLADAWDAGWRATVDARPAPVRKANVAFRGVVVPAGRHTVEMRYLPPGLALGGALSLLAAALLAATVLRSSRRHTQDRSSI